MRGGGGGASRRSKPSATSSTRSMSAASSAIWPSTAAFLPPTPASSALGSSRATARIASRFARVDGSRAASASGAALIAEELRSALEAEKPHGMVIGAAEGASLPSSRTPRGAARSVGLLEPARGADGGLHGLGELGVVVGLVDDVEELLGLRAPVAVAAVQVAAQLVGEVVRRRAQHSHEVVAADALEELPVLRACACSSTSGSNSR
mmetsp:Transcript_4947/g.16519  ORF Transcript_4947/g.16519 Transcript_4947/m.16519 type:complete len:208 (-) Transcript_4947:775-1398(-)